MAAIAGSGAYLGLGLPPRPSSSGYASGLPVAGIRPSSARSVSGTSSSTLQDLQAAEDGDGPLWTTLRKQLYRSEVSHVKRMVGEGLIRQNRLLWDEASSLRQMLSDLVQKNEELTENLEKQVKFSGSQHRDLLRRQAQIMVEGLRPRVEECGSTLENFIPELKDAKFKNFLFRDGASTERERSMYGGKGSGDSWSRPSTPSTRSPSSSRCSTPEVSSGGRSSLVLGRALGLEELVQVSDNIREALEDEQEALKAAVAETLEHLEAEAQQKGAITRQIRGEGEPSTAELQQLTHRLQDLSKSPSLQTLALVGGPSSMPSPSSRSSSLQSTGLLQSPVQGPPVPLAPLPGGASVQRLRALIAQRRRESAAPSPALCTVPEAPDSTAPVSPGGREPVAPVINDGAAPSKPPSKAFDPFFDDPFA